MNNSSFRAGQGLSSIWSPNSRNSSPPPRLILGTVLIVLFISFLTMYHTSSPSVAPFSVSSSSSSSSSSSAITSDVDPTSNSEYSAIIHAGHPPALTVSDNSFALNGIKNFRILSGAIHYFRVHPAYWKDRLQKLKDCGFNTVETYIPWNMHEPTEGHFDFESPLLHLEDFIRTAQSVGLFVIIRPGPYICAEWEFGGLPSYLLKDPNMQLRTTYKPFMDASERYLAQVFKRIKPLLMSNSGTSGGPIIAVQIENEYGSYGNNRAYMESMHKIFIKHGMESVFLFTADGSSDDMLQGGTLSNVFKAINIGDSVKKSYQKLLEYQPNQPLFVGEAWLGWFDHFGEKHHTRETGQLLSAAAASSASASPSKGKESALKTLRDILDAGGSVNVYMFHGGTNFGFWNGANHENGYAPTISSYDYDAPISESGELTPKFKAIQQMLREEYSDLLDDLKKFKVPFVSSSWKPAIHALVPTPPNAMKLEPVNMNLIGRMFDSNNGGKLTHEVSSSLIYGHQIDSPWPLTFEQLGQSLGFVLYETMISGPRAPATLYIEDVRDRAIIYLNGQQIGVYYRTTAAKTIRVEVPEADGARLSILVENMGRVNFGAYLVDRKGITKQVRLFRQILSGWTHSMLPLDYSQVSKYIAKAAEGKAVDLETQSGPAVFRGVFQVPKSVSSKLNTNTDALPDVFIDTQNLGKGVIFINGFNIGKYWPSEGPQMTLYVPGPFLYADKDNEIVAFELEPATLLLQPFALSLTSKADLEGKRQ